ncbi:lipoate--protein ligase family protein [Paenarthrobacter sp. MSM-2-10-13]|uniref:lipoate--protein ligase family protein n=1 Tax=unclassified Paenarthrobacter TaxID=2634190 RepID=UPI001421BD60|nr:MULTISPECIES: lipoate--protein ligase family protein [unclassified Paenarthrobacter]MCM0617659.1 lipoate--protein ligase family protein [Paenarthrobacter sp. TYUT067]NHW46108.1 lipoate--protein ligase family protein [Paenarthrobacter sp. MSM-2-10-13]
MSGLEAGARQLTVYRQKESMGAAADLDFALELLQRARSGNLGPSLRLYRPQPTVAFGQRDANLPGFQAAAEACRELGFEPLIRKAGGRAAAYHQGTLVIDHIEPHPDAIVRAKARFSEFGELLAGALRSVGVHAAVGEIPGEYCPGEFSVHGEDPDFPAHRIKLIGTAQRVVSGGWLFSSVIVVEDSKPIREVLAASYAALGLEWDPATAGAANDLLPHLDVQSVEDAVVEAYRGYAEVLDGDFRSLVG